MELTTSAVFAALVCTLALLLNGSTLTVRGFKLNVTEIGLLIGVSSSIDLLHDVSSSNSIEKILIFLIIMIPLILVICNIAVQNYS